MSPASAAGQPPQLRALSLGAGVQSTTLALLAVAGVLPCPDVAIFADTGWEPGAVYAHLDRLTPVLTGAGIEVVRVSNGNLRADALDPASRFAAVPYFIRNPDGSDGMGRRQCTKEYKLAPIGRKVRELLGAAPPNFRRVPAGRVCEQWIGFSADEIGRVSDKPRLSYVRKAYPLIDLGWTRKDCQRWLERQGWAEVAKSACVGCPFHGNRAWREMREQRPAEWADAVAFDAAIRRGARGGRADLSLRGQAFLHRARVPLDQAPIERVTRAEWADRQTDIFDYLPNPADPLDQLAELGDPDGCSPYGCRSGPPTLTSEAGAA